MAYDFLKDSAKSREKLLKILGEVAEDKVVEKPKVVQSYSGEGEVLEEGPGYRIVKRRGEKTPLYIMDLPEMTGEERETIKTITKSAIGEIQIDQESLLMEKKKEAFIKEVKALMAKSFPLVALEKRDEFAEFIVQDMIGYSRLDPLLANDMLEEVMVVGTQKAVYVYHRKLGMCRTNIAFSTDDEIKNVVDRIARTIGRRVDISSPLLDARLPDGSRVNATIKPVSLDGPSLTIRKFKADPFTVVDIIKFGTVSPELAAFLWLAVEGFSVKPANILVSGGTGSGKTTTLNCLASFIPSTDRVITIEDTAELQLPIDHWIPLETRPPNIEGKGEVSMDMLLKNTLRMRPDRIIVGEVRGAEAGTLMAAMNTGQNGCLGTLHANTAKETITRLTNAPMSVPMVMIPSLNLILMQNRFAYGGRTVRRITEIAEVGEMEDGQIRLNTLYAWDPKDDKIKSTGAPSIIKRGLMELRGVGEKEMEEELARREEVVKYMMEKGIRGVREVGRVVNAYYISPDRYREAIEALFQEAVGRRTIPKADDEGYGFLERVLSKPKAAKAPGPSPREVIEELEGHRIFRVPGEKNPYYMVPLLELSEKERALLEDLEREAIGSIEVDPASMEKEECERFFREEILKLMEKKHQGLKADSRERLAEIILKDMIGYGVMEFLLSDDALEEIMAVGNGKPIYVNHRKYGTCKTNVRFRSDDEALRVIGKIASSVGRRVDRSTPLLDARLLDGSRANATIPPISLKGPTLTIRKFKKDPLTVVNLIKLRTLSAELAAYLWLAVEGLGIKPGNVLIAGGAGCGKTTTLNSLCSFIPTTARVITIEDTAELHLPIEHCIRLETRPPNVEGEGEVSMEALVKNTLRMRPDRIIVGEVRGPEAKTMFTAMNTGHDGCMGTLHSNSARETIVRLTNPPMSVPEIMLPALDLILMQNKMYHGGENLRRITEIAEVGGLDKEGLVLNDIYRWDPKKDEIAPTGSPSLLKRKVAALKGLDAEGLEAELRDRETVFRWMVKRDIKGIKDVIVVFGRYYTDKKGLMAEVERGLKGA
ncbi:MAG: CpaF family protein [Euryarchaeota archaeon]|nr:CpaF family protein [Euryarchaeota archaeon]